MSSGKELAPSKPQKYPTTVRFDEDDLPELTKWKVGGRYQLTLEVEQISMSKGDEYQELGESSKDKPKVRASFKVLSVSTPDGKPDAKRPSMLANAMKKKMM